MGIAEYINETMNLVGQSLNMIAALTLSQWANLATILAATVAVGALLYTAKQVHRNALTNRGTFWLELEKMFRLHDPVHLKLRPGGEWSDKSTGPKNAKEWAELEDYMGLFEHCEIMMNLGLIDGQTFSDIFAYRLRNIAGNPQICDKKLRQEAESWQRFLSLLQRFNISIST
ncbi:MAG: hypothetical protein ACYSWO_18670 [Planctomycetota bacterium]|jgi:hypothetical protein